MPFSRFGQFVSITGLCLLYATCLHAQTGVLGTWTEPTGSSISVERCGADVCLRLVLLSPKAPVSTDSHNPDPALRNRSLCGLKIGSGFRLEGDSRAEGGTLYDPKSGKTYKGSMTRVGNELHLRGYVGVKLFGATETWVPAKQVALCDSKR